MPDLLGLGSSAVAAYRTALTAIGENVANAETPGYARREVRLREGGTATSTSLVYQSSYEFGGVRSDQVTRAWDQFRATDARLTAASAGRASTRETWYTNVESVLSDDDAGIGASLRGFFNAGTTLSANPDDSFGRRSMLTALNDTASAFRTTADGLAKVSASIGDSAKLEVTNLNNELKALAAVNAGLQRAPANTPVSASLEDERDRLLDSISERIDVNVTLDARGRATVAMSNSPGQVLVDLNESGRVALTAATDGRLSLSLSADGNVTPLAPTGGKLAGLVDSAAATADRRADLDSMAADFAAAVNGWQAQGRTAAGTPGLPLLQMPNGAASLQTLSSDPASIAAAAADGTPNGNLIAMAAMRTDTGAEARWAGLVNSQALMLSSAKFEASAAATQRDNSFAARDAVSGIDLDQEAAELMRFQQAYSGATKIIQVARETMQNILDLF